MAIGLLQTMDRVIRDDLAQATTTTDIWMRYHRAAWNHRLVKGEAAKAAEVLARADAQKTIDALWLASYDKYFPSAYPFGEMEVLLNLDVVQGTGTIIDNQGTGIDWGILTAETRADHAEYGGAGLAIQHFLGKQLAFVNTINKPILADNDFTLEFSWDQNGLAQDAFSRIFGMRNGDLLMGIVMYTNAPTTPTKITLSMANNGSSNTFTMADVYTMPSSGFVKLCVERFGDVVRFYADGSEIAQAAFTGTVYVANQTSDTWTLGGQSVGTSRNAYGKYDNFRLTNGTALYQGDYTVATEAFPES